MRWFTVLAASLAGHTAVLAAVPAGGARLVPRGVAQRVEPVEVQVEWLDVAVEEPPPVEVALVELAPAPETETVTVAETETATETVTETVTEAVTVTEAATAAGTETAIVTGHATGSETGTGTGTGTEVETGVGAMSMRQGKPDLSLPTGSGVITAIINRPSPPPEDIAAELEPQRDGTHVKNDLVFVATVEPDGNVKFEDKPNFRYKFHLPNPVKIARGVKRHLASWAEDPTGVATDRTKKNRDGTDDDHDGKLDEGDTVTILSGGFDLTDWAMRSQGDDPYTSRKMAFLDRTRTDRVAIGGKYRADQLDAADQYMLDHLRALWKRDDLDAEARRAEVFALWDDCAEAGEARVVEAAARARAALYRFVATKLPPGSRDAYTADELARLNATRKSRATFAPYD